MKRVLDCHHTRAGNPAILSSDSCLLTSTFLLLLILAAPALCAGKWQVAYFYDKEGSSLVINDLQFPSPARGIAAGYLEEKGGSKPVSVTTDDGGAHWTVSKLKQVPISLFFLNDKLGWMVTPEGIWRTIDAGREWRELPKSPKLLMKVYFVDEARGFAIGAHKLAYQTGDGGKTWEPIAAAEEPHTDPEYTVYNNITFVNGKTGMIDGFSAPPRFRQARLAGRARHHRAARVAALVDHAGYAGWRQDVEAVHGFDVRPHHARVFPARWPGPRADRIHRHVQVAVGGPLNRRHYRQEQHRLQRHGPGYYGRAAAALRDRIFGGSGSGGQAATHADPAQVENPAQRGLERLAGDGRRLSGPCRAGHVAGGGQWLAVGGHGYGDDLEVGGVVGQASRPAAGIHAGSLTCGN